MPKPRLRRINPDKTLVVRTYMWTPTPNREYTNREGNQVRFTHLEDARTYAANNSYKGIYVQYC